MINLDIQDLHKSKAQQLLTTQETLNIVGGQKVVIDNSFNDRVSTGGGDDIAYSDPRKMLVPEGTEIEITNSFNDIISTGGGDDRVYSM